MALGDLIASGDAANAARRWSDAAEAYRKALELDPSLAPIWVQFGHALKEQGDIQGAISAYSRAAVIAPADFDPHFQLGHALKSGGDTPGAIAAFRRASAIDPAHEEAKLEIDGLSAVEWLPMPRAAETTAASIQPGASNLGGTWDVNSGRTLLAAWEALVVSERGFFVEGWADDRSAPLAGFRLAGPATREDVALPAYRLRRSDVENHLQCSQQFEFGIWTAGRLLPGLTVEDLTLSLLGLEGAQRRIQLPNPIRKPGPEFLDFLLVHFGRRGLLGDLTVRSLAELDAGHGALLGATHEDVAATRGIRLRATFGPRTTKCRLSLVCVLLGIPDFLYLLISEFARFGPLDGLEFVFVCNSPELEEVLVRDAELASFVFGARISLVGLNQNCGFSHANNVGVDVAQASTVGIINPDVYPRDAAAVAHILSLAEASLGNNLVGAKLYYADGSVMHEGMFFAPDHKLSALAGSRVWTVEHFRKGFPDTTAAKPRRVPAVTGALMVLEKALYERMGGFDTGFIFGHYEDADLCLRIRQAGGNVLLDPALAYWHYEGMGSTKRPAQVGSRLYNRWLFTRRWGDQLEAANNV